MDHLNVAEHVSQKGNVANLSQKRDFVRLDNAQMPDWADSSSGKKSSHPVMGSVFHLVLKQLNSLGSPDAVPGSCGMNGLPCANPAAPASKQVLNSCSLYCLGAS